MLLAGTGELLEERAAKMCGKREDSFEHQKKGKEKKIAASRCSKYVALVVTLEPSKVGW